MADLRCKFDWQLQDSGWIGIHFVQIHTSDNLFCSNSFPILELSVKFASQICHENTNTPLDGAYLAAFGIDINVMLTQVDTLVHVTYALHQLHYGLLYCSGFCALRGQASDEPRNVNQRLSPLFTSNSGNNRGVFRKIWIVNNYKKEAENRGVIP